MARRPLTRRRILKAALRLIDREGVDALSMRKLGATLGVEAMALYRHVGGKEDLLDGVVELMLEELEIPRAGAEPWTEAWTRIARSYRRLAHSHPRAFRLLALSPLSTAARFERAQAPLALLRDAGFDEDGAQLAFRTLLGYADGYLLRELAGTTSSGERQDGEDAFQFGIRVIIAGLQAELVSARSTER